MIFRKMSYQNFEVIKKHRLSSASYFEKTGISKVSWYLEMVAQYISTYDIINQ